MLYYFYGLDEWGMKQAIRDIAGSKDDEIIDIITFDGLELEARTLEQEIISISFFASKKVVIIENLSINKKTTELEKISQLLTKSTDHLEIIFAEYKVPDKRTQLHKQLSKLAKTREFITPSQGELVQRIKQMVISNSSNIDNRAAILLAAMIPTDSLRLKNEIDKLSMLKLKQEISEADVAEMIAAEINPNIFNFVENLANRQLGPALKALDKLIESGQNENYILTMITWQYRQLLIVKSQLLAGRTTAGQAGINPFVFGKLLMTAKKYDLKELKEIYSLIEKTDFGIKSGALEAKLALVLVAARLTSC